MSKQVVPEKNTQVTNKNGTSKDKNDKREERERGFEALLKPIQDIIAKDWKVRLCKYLDIYMEHLHNAGHFLINFSEAAILLQNTSRYYSRRVDLMYNWVLQFTMSLSKPLEDGPTDDNESGQPQKKASASKKRVLQTDTLECLDCLVPDAKINVNQEKVDDEPNKQILLNMSMKAACKASTTCTVFQTNNEEMGYKEEFRLHWRISNDGPLREDFYNSSSKCLISAGMDDESFVAEDTGRDGGMDMTMEQHAVTPMNIDHDSYEEFDQSVCENLEENNILPEDPFCRAIPIALVIIHRKFKKARCSKKAMEDKGKQKKKDEASEDHINYHLSFSEILGGVKEDIIAFRLRKRREKKLKLHQEKKADINKNFRTAQTDDAHHDIDDEEDYEECLMDLDNSFDGVGGLNAASPDFANACSERLQVLQDFFKAKSEELHSATAVNKWHLSVEHVVRDAQKNSIFDVHAYGTKVIEKFGGLGETKSFASIVEDQPRKEICRYLLSSLMLANTYNVELSKTDPSELSKDCLMLKLISTVRHHEELDANVGATTGT